MRIRPPEVICLSLIAVSFVAAFYFYAHFPDRVPSHWNFRNEIDGYSGPGFAAFFFPFLTSAVYALMLFLPQLDPKRERYRDFRKVYDILKVSIVSFLTLVYFIVGVNGIGYRVNVGAAIVLLVGLLIALIGNYLGEVKSNWFVGIRNPWTISNESVWDKTHQASGRLFVVCGLLLMASILFSPLVKTAVFILVIATLVVVPNVYSYILYRRIKHL